MPESHKADRVLLVDDNPVNLQVLYEALEAEGVSHQLILLEGANHNLGGIDPGKTENALRKAMAFVRFHMEE